MIDTNLIAKLLPMLQGNPMGIVQQSGFNIPQGQQFNSPKDIVEYLMNSGQIDQNIYNNARAQAEQMGYKV